LTGAFATLFAGDLAGAAFGFAGAAAVRFVAFAALAGAAFTVRFAPALFAAFTVVRAAVLAAAAVRFRTGAVAVCLAGLVPFVALDMWSFRVGFRRCEAAYEAAHGRRRTL
jgi:hypothetical protein